MTQRQVYHKKLTQAWEKTQQSCSLGDLHLTCCLLHRKACFPWFFTVCVMCKSHKFLTFLSFGGFLRSLSLRDLLVPPDGKGNTTHVTSEWQQVLCYKLNNALKFSRTWMKVKEDLAQGNWCPSSHTMCNIVFSLFCIRTFPLIDSWCSSEFIAK